MRNILPLLLTSLCLGPIAGARICVKLERPKLDKGGYIGIYDQIPFVTVAVSETSVLLSMATSRYKRTQEIYSSRHTIISSVICQCLLSSLYRDIDIQNAYTDGFRCFNDEKEFLVSAAKSKTQLPAVFSNDVPAPTEHASSKVGWKQTMQSLIELSTSKKAATAHSLRCVKILSSGLITSSSELPRNLFILDGRIDDDKEIYVLQILNKSQTTETRPVEYNKCGYENDQSMAETHSLVARTDSELEKFYTKFGGDVTIQSKAVYDPAICIFVEGNSDKFLSKLREYFTNAPRIELVAHIDDYLLFSFSGNENYVKGALEYMRDTKQKVNDTKAYIVSELLCDYTSHLINSQRDVKMQAISEQIGGSSAAQKKSKAATKTCVNATPTNVNLCRRAAVSGRGLGIVTFNKKDIIRSGTINTDSSWRICFSRIAKLNLQTEFRGICQITTIKFHNDENTVKVSKSKFQDMLRTIYVGADPDPYDIFNVLRKKEFTGTDGDKNQSKQRKRSNASRDADERKRVANDVVKGNDKSGTVTSHKNRYKRKTAANTSIGCNVVEGENAVVEGNDVAGEVDFHKNRDKRKRVVDTFKEENEIECEKAMEKGAVVANNDNVLKRMEGSKSSREADIGTRVADTSKGENEKEVETTGEGYWWGSKMAGASLDSIPHTTIFGTKVAKGYRFQESNLAI